MSKIHNIQPDAMLIIVKKFQPLYDQMNQENQKLVYEAFEDFFEAVLEKSFNTAREDEAGNYIT